MGFRVVDSKDWNAPQEVPSILQCPKFKLPTKKEGECWSEGELKRIKGEGKRVRGTKTEYIVAGVGCFLIGERHPIEVEFNGRVKLKLDVHPVRQPIIVVVTDVGSMPVITDGEAQVVENLGPERAGHDHNRDEQTESYSALFAHSYYYREYGS